jgi:hypothetical protein
MVQLTPSLLLKVDITKAFDSVSWPFLLRVLQHLGVGRLFREWVCIILASASSKVVLNGVPGNTILHRRGLRQGDPLSPTLFLFVMEVLNALLRHAENLQLLAPLPCRGVRFRTSMYADDVVMFISPTARELGLVRGVLQCFGGASGLHTNLGKCSISPIRCTDEHLAIAAQEFPCGIKTFPCTYLGLPLSYKRLPKSSLQPIVDNVCRRLSPWLSKFYTSAGRLVLIKSVVTAIPIYLSIAMDLPQWLLDFIDKRIRAFFWKGSETVNGGQCLVAWERVCRPVEYGGLGILNLKLLGYALRIRWLWLKKIQDGCWTGLKLNPEPEVQAMFDDSIRIVVGDGRMALFWTDPWLNSASIKQRAPALFAAVEPRTRNTRTVADALADRRWIRDVTGALSVPALVEFLELVDTTQHVPLSPDVPDQVQWKLTASGVYSAESAYRAFFTGMGLFPCGKAIWRTWAPAKCKVHIWLAMQRRLWTADRMARRGLNARATCPLCEQENETADHIAVGCVLVREVWYNSLQRCNLQHLTPAADDELIRWWPEARLRVPRPHRKGFDSIVLLVVWTLWKERNSRVFERYAETLPTICQRIADEVELWKLSGAAGLALIWS